MFFLSSSLSCVRIHLSAWNKFFVDVFFLNLCICSSNPVDLNQRFPLCTDPAVFISSEKIEDLIKYEGISIKDTVHFIFLNNSYSDSSDMQIRQFCSISVKIKIPKVSKDISNQSKDQYAGSMCFLRRNINSKYFKAAKKLEQRSCVGVAGSLQREETIAHRPAGPTQLSKY